MGAVSLLTQVELDQGLTELISKLSVMKHQVPQMATANELAITPNEVLVLVWGIVSPDTGCS